MKKQSVVCIVGPTASGKTALSIALAKQYDAEIVSADSMQIYRDLNIGTAKPSVSERDGVVHHMLDVVSPFEDYSVARYVEEAERVISDIHARGKLPIIVGGTGLYIDSLMRGATFAAQVQDENFRVEMEVFAKENGNFALHQKLRAIDPAQADRLHENDVKRVIRALEVYHTTGKLLSEHNAETADLPQKYNACWLGLAYENRQVLYDRIDRRVNMMIEAGLMEELQSVQAQGISRDATAMQAIGYKELWDVPFGEPLEIAVERLKQATRRYAKRQLTWFRRNQRIHWLSVDCAENFDSLLLESTSFIQNCDII